MLIRGRAAQIKLISERLQRSVLIEQLVWGMDAVRPVVTTREARHLAVELFGIHAHEIRELTAFDDRNFYLRSGSLELVLKVTNSEDSLTKVEHFRKLAGLMSFLASEGFQVPQCFPALDGEIVKVVEIGTQKHALRMFRFVKGEILDKAPKGSESLYRATGAYVAELASAMQKYPQKQIFDYTCEWHLEAAWKTAKDKITCIPEAQRREIANIFRDFEALDLGAFERGLIHSDLNAANIIVGEGGEVLGCIDFNEATLSYVVFDLAVLLAEIMEHADDFRAAKHVLEGYLSIRGLRETEKRALLLCVKTRICCCIVLCTSASSRDPDNAYLSESLPTYWRLLDELRGQDGNMFVRWSDEVKKSSSPA